MDKKNNNSISKEFDPIEYIRTIKTEFETMNQSNSHEILNKYFSQVYENSFREPFNEKLINKLANSILRWCKIDYSVSNNKISNGENIINLDLEELLELYGLSEWRQVFYDLAIILLKQRIYSDINIQFRETFIRLLKDENEIINASKALKKKNISSLKLIISSGNKNQSFVLKEPQLINHIGKLLYQEYNTKPKKLGYSTETLIPYITKINKAEWQAFISYQILNFLDKETELKRKKNIFISNEQARFIYDFLELSNFLKIETSKVRKEEYIRTLLYNYKDKLAPGIG